MSIDYSKYATTTKYVANNGCDVTEIVFAPIEDEDDCYIEGECELLFSDEED